MADDKSTEGTATAKTYTEEEFKTALEKEKAYVIKYKEDADRYKSTAEKFKDIDPDKYKAMSERIAQLEKDEAFAGGKEKIDELIANKEKDIEAKFRTKYQGEIDELKSSFNATSAELNKLRVVNPSLEVALKAGLNEDMLDIFSDMIAKEAFYDQKTGKIYIKGERDGEPRYSEKNIREAMDVAEFVEILRTKKASMFKPTQKSGGMQGGEQSKNYTSGSGLTMERWLSLSEADRKKLDPKVNAEFTKQYFN